jgi:uncharacterized damage-inducible protein DinB
MFRTMDDFYHIWTQESDSTMKILNALSDESLEQAVAPGHQTLGWLGWHLVTTIHEMVSRTGLQFDAPEDEETPKSARAIAEGYLKAGESMIAAMRESWNDNTLILSVNMYGEEWPNSQTLWVLIEHQIHHRGQMTVLMRQAGLKVPGIYGPSKEEWQSMGMNPPSI